MILSAQWGIRSVPRAEVSSTRNQAIIAANKGPAWLVPNPKTGGGFPLLGKKPVFYSSHQNHVNPISRFQSVHPLDHRGDSARGLFQFRHDHVGSITGPFCAEGSTVLRRNSRGSSREERPCPGPLPVRGHPAYPPRRRAASQLRPGPGDQPHIGIMAFRLVQKKTG